MNNGSTAIATAESDIVRSALSQVEQEEKLFELAQRKAQIYAKSTLVPKEYQNNVGNVLIATNMAHRMGADVLMVMQNLFVVHGRPGWSSQFLIGTFNTNGRFTAIKYRFTGEPKTPEWGCQAYCTEKNTGEVIEGTWITWDMANREGWVNKAGSKWQTIPEQMFRYRSAAFLIRATAPEIGLGLLTKEELDDMRPSTGFTGEELASGIAGLKSRMVLANNGAEVNEEVVDAPFIDDVPIIDVETREVDAESSAEVTAPEPPIDELADLRNHVKDQLDALPKNRQKDILAGKESISKMDRDQLTQLETLIGKAQDS